MAGGSAPLHVLRWRLRLCLHFFFAPTTTTTTALAVRLPAIHLEDKITLSSSYVLQAIRAVSVVSRRWSSVVIRASTTVHVRRPTAQRTCRHAKGRLGGNHAVRLPERVHSPAASKGLLNGTTTFPVSDSGARYSAGKSKPFDHRGREITPSAPSSGAARAPPAADRYGIDMFHGCPPARRLTAMSGFLMWTWRLKGAVYGAPSRQRRPARRRSPGCAWSRGDRMAKGEVAPLDGRGSPDRGRVPRRRGVRRPGGRCSSARPKVLGASASSERYRRSQANDLTSRSGVSPAQAHLPGPGHGRDRRLPNRPERNGASVGEIRSHRGRIVERRRPGAVVGQDNLEVERVYSVVDLSRSCGLRVRTGRRHALIGEGPAVARSRGGGRGVFQASPLGSGMSVSRPKPGRQGLVQGLPCRPRCRSAAALNRMVALVVAPAPRGAQRGQGRVLLAVRPVAKQALPRLQHRGRSRCRGSARRSPRKNCLGAPSAQPRPPGTRDRWRDRAGRAGSPGYAIDAAAGTAPPRTDRSLETPWAILVAASGPSPEGNPYDRIEVRPARAGKAIAHGDLLRSGVRRPAAPGPGVGDGPFRSKVRRGSARDCSSRAPAPRLAHAPPRPRNPRCSPRLSLGVVEGSRSPIVLAISRKTSLPAREAARFLPVARCIIAIVDVRNSHRDHRRGGHRRVMEICSSI